MSVIFLYGLTGSVLGQQLLNKVLTCIHPEFTLFLADVQRDRRNIEVHIGLKLLVNGELGRSKFANLKCKILPPVYFRAGNDGWWEELWKNEEFVLLRDGPIRNIVVMSREGDPKKAADEINSLLHYLQPGIRDHTNISVLLDPAILQGQNLPHIPTKHLTPSVNDGPELKVWYRREREKDMATFLAELQRWMELWERR